ncbi:efflux RND transporter periplasmic adaptor subunit [Singulisphaera rosea]
MTLSFHAARGSERDAVTLGHCTLEYAASTRIGIHATSIGFTSMQDCYANPGDRVKTGQVLGRVADRDLRADRETLQAEMDSDIEIRAAELKRDLMVSKQARSARLQARGPGYVSEEENTSQRLETQMAVLEIQKASFRRELLRKRIQALDVQLQAREFVSPHNGVVVEVLKKPGEAIGPGETVFCVIDPSVVRVIGYVNLQDYWRVKPGQSVRLHPEFEGVELPVERLEFTGRVVFVDRRIEPETKTCKVVTLIENRDEILASGLEARMEIDLNSTGPEDSAAPIAPARPISPGAVGTRVSPPTTDH